MSVSSSGFVIIAVHRCDTESWNITIIFVPASVAQLDPRSTGDQEVVGLTPAGSATFFRGDWS